MTKLECIDKIHDLSVKSAKQHGQNSYPDDEIHDLRDMLHLALANLSRRELAIFVTEILGNDNVRVNSKVRDLQRIREVHNNLIGRKKL